MKNCEVEPETSMNSASNCTLGESLDVYPHDRFAFQSNAILGGTDGWDESNPATYNLSITDSTIDPTNGEMSNMTLYMPESDDCTDGASSVAHSPPDLQLLPPRAAPLKFNRSRSRGEKYPLRYQADYRGDLPSDNQPLQFWMARSDNSELRMSLLLVGEHNDRLSLQLLDKNFNEYKCKIEPVKDRLGCTQRLKTDSRLFLVTITPAPERKNRKIQFYWNIDSTAGVKFIQ